LPGFPPGALPRQREDVLSLNLALQFASRSDAGMVRSRNEDSIYTSASLGLAILADGMGGYNAGEVASSMATSLLGTEMERALAHTAPYRVDPEGRPLAHELLAAEIARANEAIYRAARNQPQYAGMGTTLVVALFYDNSLTVAHIGDSRLYRLRGSSFEALTRDHSLLQEQIDSGMITQEEARFSQNRNLVTRALGIDPEVDAELRDYDTLPGDIYLLCSDGLNDMVADAQIAAALRASGEDAEAAANRLVQLANDSGGRDNVSVILVRVLREYPANRGLLGSLMGLFR
jgi:protein phosphatase